MFVLPACIAYSLCVSFIKRMVRTGDLIEVWLNRRTLHCIHHHCQNFLSLSLYKFHKTKHYFAILFWLSKWKQRFWKISPHRPTNDDVYFTNRIWRNFPFPTKLILSVINLCWLVSWFVPLWLALCQLLLFSWMDGEACTIRCRWVNMCLRVWLCASVPHPACVSCICTRLNITFYLLVQGPPGLAGTPGEKVGFMSKILSIKMCFINCRSFYALCIAV